MLEKLEITAYENETFTTRANLANAEKNLNFSINPLKVPINPEKYSRSITIKYTDDKGMGSAGGSPQFNKIAFETVTFELVFDATGVLPSTPAGTVRPAPTGALPPSMGAPSAPPMSVMVPATANGVADQVQALRTLTCDYDGAMHSPRFLTLAWGTLLFKCRLETLDLNYTLFKPNGMPLRARADAKFLGFTDEAELNAKIKKNSPDLTHVLTVRAGDTLPLMCNRVYGRSDYYSQVAEVNGLTGFRDLRPGMQLVFPPLAGPV